MEIKGIRKIEMDLKKRKKIWYEFCFILVLMEWIGVDQANANTDCKGASEIHMQREECAHIAK